MEHIFNLRQLAADTCPKGKTPRVHYNDVINAFGGNVNALDGAEIEAVAKHIEKTSKAAASHLRGLKKSKRKA